MARAWVVVGMGFGDESKGATVDHLVRRHNVSLVTRFNGGAQAAHNVICPDGRHHTFSQFGAGTLAGSDTYLSRFMLVNPITMISEARHLEEIGVKDPLSKMIVDRDALVTTPIHMAMNRIREMHRGNGRHGSCGMGIGETQSDAIGYGDAVLRVGDLDNEAELRRKLQWLHEMKWREAQEILREKLEINSAWRPSSAFSVEWDILSDPDSPDKITRYFRDWRKQVMITNRDFLRGFRGDNIVFEGAQGVLLDENYGFHPHTTWSTTTFKNADELLQGLDFEVARVGCLRAYHTRHGAGPFPTFNTMLTRELHDAHNSSDHAYQQTFRVGDFDAMLLRYAMHVVGKVDEIALSHLDRVPEKIQVATKYGQIQADSGRVAHAKFDDLRPHDSGTLHGQEELGRILGFLRPHYEQFTHDEFFALIERETKARVSLLGYGPKATDKRVR